MSGELQISARFPECSTCPRYAAGPAGACLACACGRLDRPGPDACPTCSQRVSADGRCANELCGSPSRRIGRIHAIAYHSGPLRRAINAYKYGPDRSWAVIFGRLLLAWLDENLTADPPALIVAHPSFVGPGGQQFAHTEAVIRAAALEARARPQTMPRWRFDTAEPRAIVKTAATLKSADMAAWSKHASATELRGSLRIPDPARTSGRYLLVYDDICTTGSQLDAVACCLLEEGRAARVDAIVLARAPWRGLVPSAST